MPQPQTAGSDSLECSVLVLSCDRYRDLWRPFFHLFQRYWPDCAMPVYLGTQSVSADLDGVQILQAGAGEYWSQRLRFYLQTIPSEYVLLLLEDFFLDRPVLNSEINRQLQVLHQLNGWQMRLFPNPPPDYRRNGIGILHPRAWYRVSLQAAIWKRAHLMQLLVDPESPWEFEVQGSRRSRSQATGFYSVSEAVVHYRHVVERGAWFRSAAAFYATQNIGCDFAARPIIGYAEACKKFLINRSRKVANWLHSRWVRCA